MYNLVKLIALRNMKVIEITFMLSMYELLCQRVDIALAMASGKTLLYLIVLFGLHNMEVNGKCAYGYFRLLVQ